MRHRCNHTKNLFWVVDLNMTSAQWYGYHISHLDTIDRWRKISWRWLLWNRVGSQVVPAPLSASCLPPQQRRPPIASLWMWSWWECLHRKEWREIRPQSSWRIPQGTGSRTSRHWLTRWEFLIMSCCFNRVVKFMKAMLGP